MGDGLPPIPARIAVKIGRWEFIEMYELLPEFWMQKGEDQHKGKQLQQGEAKRRIQDINVWLQCFALYVGVMAKKSPQHVPEQMAYMISILRTSQEYEGRHGRLMMQLIDDRQQPLVIRNGRKSTPHSTRCVSQERPERQHTVIFARVRPTKQTNSI